MSNPDRLSSALRVLCTTLALALALVSTSAVADESWQSLSPMQKEALAPLAQQWDTLPEPQQRHLIATTRRYPHLNHEQKQRFRSKLEKWSKLTPEQRKAARDKYRAFSKVPAEKREQVKKMVKQEQTYQPPASVSGVPNTK